MENEGKRPIEKIKLGSVTASIWKNETKHGYRYGVTFNRIYKVGDEWQVSATFGWDELLLLSKAANESHDKMRVLMDGDKKQSKEVEE